MKGDREADIASVKRGNYIQVFLLGAVRYTYFLQFSAAVSIVAGKIVYRKY
jgi:hypothetical protein